ncbi:sigma-54-dependent transcriptional regulator [Aliamphritea hakodatensis]|uniref:sigma-54-dependent transcriptional regulator n=1 Tax=Aliamphritea hakodatensis TaxID=2895352 RepID=UPI0022FD73D0|nr:sigma-54 dependent transcriptional regulator [Aliamphritea hakodatensis]
MPNSIMLVDDEKHIRVAVGQTLQLAGYDVTACEAAEEALTHLDSEWPGIVVTDISMPGMGGLGLLERARRLDADLPVILITGHGDISMAVQAMRDGAYDFIEKPFSSELLVDVIRRAQEKRNLTLENRKLRKALQAQGGIGPRIIGESPSIQQLRNMIQHVADTPADILLHAETGSGKDLVARYIHEHSNRRDKNFVAINCGAVPENLIESELFGHEKGAFTDAKQRRIGKFEHANGGTLFLDEIESMPLALQVKLLRVLEERSIERLGSNQQIPLDLRVIAATKVDLKQLSEEGEYRQDLYYRLNVLQLPIPPLRERSEDIPMLFQHFALIASAQYHREVPQLSSDQLALLMAHNWPGNVRELRNVAEGYVLLGDAYTFDFDEPDGVAKAGLTLPEQVEQFERLILQKALGRCQGSIKDTQTELGLPRKTLYDKMKKYGLDKSEFKH